MPDRKYSWPILRGRARDERQIGSVGLTQATGYQIRAGEAHPGWKNIGLLELAERGRDAGAPRGIKDAYARMAMSVLLSAHREQNYSNRSRRRTNARGPAQLAVLDLIPELGHPDVRRS